MLTMISAAPMIKYWGTSQNTLMGTGSVLLYRLSPCTWPSLTTSTMAATTIDSVDICRAGYLQPIMCRNGMLTIDKSQSLVSYHPQPISRCTVDSSVL